MRLLVYKKTAVEAKCYMLYYLNSKFLFNKPHYATDCPMIFSLLFSIHTLGFFSDDKGNIKLMINFSNQVK